MGGFYFHCTFVLFQIERIKAREETYRERASAAGVKVSYLSYTVLTIVNKFYPAFFLEENSLSQEFCKILQVIITKCKDMVAISSPPDYMRQ